MNPDRRRVYLDHHAATPLCPAAVAAMAAAGPSAWANPASPHSEGRAARSLLERARQQVAAALGARAADVVLTSGGTEACNLGVLGLCASGARHVVTTVAEHPAVARAVDRLAASGMRVTRLGFDADAAALRAALTPETGLVAVQWVNHELGHVWPVPAWAQIAAERGVPVLVDATQALGKLPIDLAALPVTGLAVAAHKAGGPPGAGALWVGRRAAAGPGGQALQPQLLGGGQERGRRAGSPDVLSAVGFGAACEQLTDRLLQQARIAALRDRLEHSLVALGARPNRTRGPRVATVSNVSFVGRRAEVLVAALDLQGIAVAAGAACSSGLASPSPSVQALHPDDEERARTCIRFSFGPENTENDVEIAERESYSILSRIDYD